MSYLRYIKLFLMLAVFASASHAQMWECVGQSDFTVAGIEVTGLELDATNAVYVSYLDNAGSCIVSKYNGSSWVNVGMPQTLHNQSIDQMKMKLGPDQRPYILIAGSLTAEVRRYDGNNWVLVGDSTFAPYRLRLIDLDISADSIPFIAFTGYNLNTKARVMRLVNGVWDTVGRSYVSPGDADAISLAIGKDRLPSLAFADGDFIDRPTLMKFNGIAWDTIGARGIGSFSSMPLYLDMDSADQPFISFINGVQTKILLYQTGGWNDIISNLPVVGTNMGFAIDGTGRSIIAVHDTLDGALDVARFEAGTWHYLGNRITPHGALSFRLAISSVGTPYVAYKDGVSDKLSVLRLNSGVAGISATDNENVFIYPVPAHDYIAISHRNGVQVETIGIYTIEGKELSELCPKTDSTIDISAMPAGVFWLDLLFADGAKVHRKILKL